MIFKNGKKFKSVFINGKSWERGYLNGNLIFLKPSNSKSFVDLWWQNDSGQITKETIETIDDLNKLCSIESSDTYTINLSNGHSFRNVDIVDFNFNNSTNFPVSIPDGFGWKWTSLSIGSQSNNSIIFIPNKCKKIGNRFMVNSPFSPSEFYLNNVTSLGYDFLKDTTFNCNIDLTNVKTIGSGFLSFNFVFNKPITCYVENIPDYFLYCSYYGKTNSFNSPVTLINTKTIGNNFISGDDERNIFNNTLSLPNTLESIGNGFLSRCNYSGIIDLSNTNISNIGSDFNNGGRISNMILPTKNPLTISDSFMIDHESSINSEFIIPSNVSYIGKAFLSTTGDNYTFNSIKCDANPSSWATDDSDYKSFCYLKYDDNNIKRITISGAYASEFINKYPESSPSATYSRCRYYYTAMSVNLLVNGSAGPINMSLNETATLVASVKGGSGSYTYKFLVWNTNTDTWFKLQDYSSNNTVTWKTESTGNRKFYVDVKDSEGTVVRSNEVTVVVSNTANDSTTESNESVII